MSEGVQRKLAAIVMADVVGYSRLISRDEPGTLAALRRHRAELIDPLIAEHGGRIVKTMGDGLLLEFPSVVNAVKCAVATQVGMAERNAGAPEDARMTFRVGVNLGDIVIDGDDIYGDGVNVAARLQEASEPGGVTVSGVAFESLGNLVDALFEDGGKQQFKNIARPIRVWHWRPSDHSELEPGEHPAASLAVAASIKRLLDRIEQPTLAVLPFVNMSRNEELEFFCDGLTESLITDLSRSARLAVASRNSSFQFKGYSRDAREIAAKLGVRYLVEGSIQAMGQHMRVNVQLIDARTDEHRWAERFDRQSSDLFSVQDELIDEIVVAIDSLVAAGEAARIRVAATEVPEARRLALMSAVHLGRSDEEGLRKSQECADKALSLEPTSVGAMLMAGISRIRRATSGWAPLEETIAEAVNLARQAEDTGIAPGSGMLMEGAASLALGDFDAAVEIGRRSVALAPNLANSHNNYARALNAVGAFDEARSEAIKGISQHPNIFPIFLMPLGISLLMTARFADANAVFERFRGLLPNATPDVMFLAASLAASGQLKAARRVCVEVTDYFPSLTISDIVRPHPFKHQEHKDRMWSYFSALKLDD